MNCLQTIFKNSAYKPNKQFLLFSVTTLLSLQIFAKTFAQQITLKEKHVPIEKVFKDLEQKYGYSFVYTEQIVRNMRDVTIDVTNASIADLLKELFKNQPVTYTLLDKVAIIKMDAGKLENKRANINIRGRIVNEDGEGIYDATVMIKGTVLGIKSDNKGYFRIDDVAENATLLITSVGYTMQDVPVNNRTYIEIVLKKYVTDMDAVVVNTGYQKIKKEQLTGSVSTLNAKTIDQRVNVSGNILESLEGKLAGLVYNPNKGELSVRGVSSFNAVRKPLVVVDGFVTEIGIESLNPNDVTSITVLKDAAAAAIYGARASNGVIVVTTRRGRSGKIKFSARAMGTYQLKNNIDDLNLLAGKEFVDIERVMAAGTNRAYYVRAKRPYSPVYDAVFSLAEGKITQTEAQVVFDKYAAINNKQQYEDIFLRNGLTQQYDFDFSGGNDKGTFITSVNHVNTNGNTFGNNNSRTVLSLKGNYSFSKRLTLDLGTSYINSKSKRINIPAYSYFKPYEMFKDDAGNPLSVLNQPNTFDGLSITKEANEANMKLGLLDMMYYPAQEIRERSINNTINAIRTQAMFNYKIMDGISVDFGGVYELSMAQTENMSTRNSYYARHIQNIFSAKNASGMAEFNVPLGDMLAKISSKVNHYTGRLQLNVDKYLGKMHNINFIAGGEIRQNKTLEYSAGYFGYDDRSLTSKPVNFVLLGGGYQSPFLGSLGGGANIFFPQSQYFYNNYNDDRFVSGYADGSYILADKYIFKGSFRIDQSNLFGADPKYRFKPLWSLGFAWRINEEKFMQSLSWIDDFKLRASYGFQGNTATNSSPFLIMSLSNSPFIPNRDLESEVVSPPNNSLRWETSGTKNLGIDFTGFNGKVNLVVDYYDKLSKDLLTSFDRDPTVGFNSAVFNIGEIQNKGLEIMLGTENVTTPKFRWSTQLTASLNKNKVLVTKAREAFISYQLLTQGRTPGYPLESIFSYQFAGLSNKGQPLVYDADGSKVLLSTGYYSGVENDINYSAVKYSGTTVPKYVLGLNNMFSYASFDVSFLFMYYGGHVMRLTAPLVSSNPIAGAEKYWQKPGDENTTSVPGYAPSTTNPNFYDYMAGYGYSSSDKFVAKANYVRLRDFIVTYNVNNTLAKKMRMDNVRLRFQAQNLFLHPFNAKDTDPETFGLSGGERAFKLRPSFSFALLTNF